MMRDLDLAFFNCFLFLAFLLHKFDFLKNAKSRSLLILHGGKSSHATNFLNSDTYERKSLEHFCTKANYNHHNFINCELVVKINYEKVKYNLMIVIAGFCAISENILTTSLAVPFI